MGGRGGVIGTILGGIAGAALGPVGLAASTGMSVLSGAAMGSRVGGVVDTLTKKSGGGEGSSSAPPAPPPPPTLADPGVQKAEKEARVAAASAKGRASTMLITPTAEGTVSKEDEVKTAKKYLLGS